jgi:hypothetical protein
VYFSADQALSAYSRSTGFPFSRMEMLENMGEPFRVLYGNVSTFPRVHKIKAALSDG